MTRKRVIVVGCGGFIGSHLLERLLAAEVDGQPVYDVVGIDTSTQKIAGLMDHPRMTFVKTYIDASNVEEVIGPHLNGCYALFSLAAVCNPAEYVANPVFTIESNFIDSYKLVELCAKKQVWMLHTSTCEVYGRTLASYLDDNRYEDPKLYEQVEDQTPHLMGPTVNQRWCYAAAKALLERYIYANHTDRGLPFTIIRPYNWFGPRMDYIPGRDGEGTPRVMACFMKALLDKEPIQLVDGGTATRTVTYIDDSVDALMRMLERPEQAQNTFFNVGNRKSEVTMAELASEMVEIYAEITGDPEVRNHPIRHVTGEEFYGPGYEDCDKRVPSVARAEERLGWRPNNDLRQTLKKTMVYFHENYGVVKPA